MSLQRRLEDLERHRFQSRSRQPSEARRRMNEHLDRTRQDLGGFAEPRTKGIVMVCPGWDSRFEARGVIHFEPEASPAEGEDVGGRGRRTSWGSCGEAVVGSVGRARGAVPAASRSASRGRHDVAEGVRASRRPYRSALPWGASPGRGPTCPCVLPWMVGLSHGWSGLRARRSRRRHEPELPQPRGDLVRDVRHRDDVRWGGRRWTPAYATVCRSGGGLASSEGAWGELRRLQGGDHAHCCRIVNPLGIVVKDSHD